MQEKHEFGLVVAEKAADAKKIAKSKWLLGHKKTHQDNLSRLKIISDVDDCKAIKKIDNWEIELILDDDSSEETNYPDWFGYLRIDHIVWFTKLIIVWADYDQFFLLVLRLIKLSSEKNLRINNEIIAAKYPEILRNGGSINGSAIIIFNEGFIFS